MLEIALAQTVVSGDKAANIEAIATALRAAAGARLVVFPEASMYYFGKPTEPLAPVAEALDGPFALALRRLAREHRTWILAGMFERIDGSPCVYNTLVLIDDAGDSRGTYRKIHLYDAFGYRESDRIAAGDGRTLSFEIDGVRLAALTCYDLRFPEQIRHLAASGAQAIVLPAAWLAGPLKEMHLFTLLRARAIENTVYVGCADQCTPGYSGNTALFDPLGVVLASAGESPAVVRGTIDPERVATVRGLNPSLANSRPDLYARWLEAAAALR
ncbi:MAG: carbon-nitrogen hydrolase family protein [Candidatus Eremiobacteraeota bacterium]|nr:carbon-nitrogen hydrolase family protein [Candidatus Eremiobacteraeota bacterium]